MENEYLDTRSPRIRHLLLQIHKGVGPDKLGSVIVRSITKALQTIIKKSHFDFARLFRSVCDGDQSSNGITKEIAKHDFGRLLSVQNSGNAQNPSAVAEQYVNNTVRQVLDVAAIEMLGNPRFPTAGDFEHFRKDTLAHAEPEIKRLAWQIANHPDVPPHIRRPKAEQIKTGEELIHLSIARRKPGA